MSSLYLTAWTTSHLLVHVTDDSAHSVPAVYCVLQDHAVEDSLFSTQMAPQLGCSLPGPF